MAATSRGPPEQRNLHGIWHPTLFETAEGSMNIDKRWLLAIAVVASAAAAATVAATSRRRNQRAAHHLQHATDLKSWENEGGNLAPVPEAAVAP